jgi:hypothetical protein
MYDGLLTLTHPHARAGMLVPSLSCTVRTMSEYVEQIEKNKRKSLRFNVIGSPATSASLPPGTAESFWTGQYKVSLYTFSAPQTCAHIFERVVYYLVVAFCAIVAFFCAHRI